MGVGKAARWLRAPVAAIPENLGLLPSTYVSCNNGSRGFSALFWSLWIHYVHIHMETKCPYIFFKRFKNGEERRNQRRRD